MPATDTEQKLDAARAMLAALEVIGDPTLWDENNPNALKTILSMAATAIAAARAAGIKSEG